MIADIGRLAEEISKLDNVIILTHMHPDGDCIGAALGLCYFIRECGRRANIADFDNFPKKFESVCSGYTNQSFEPKTVVSVDVADVSLLEPELMEKYGDRIDLCIDHHISNKIPAKESYVDGNASATCLIIYEAIKSLGCYIPDFVADSLYTGIATDTGCFMFQNTTPAAHRAAAELIELGAKYDSINRAMFQTKSRGRIMMEQKVIKSMEFSGGGKIALIVIRNSDCDEYAIDRADLDCFAGIPLSVDGTEIGITLKQQPESNDVYKASIRTVSVDASAIAATFGGGGHIRAAGCTISGSEKEVIRKILETAERFL